MSTETNDCSTACATQHMLTAQPPADIFETEMDYRIAVDMPGIAEDRVKVRIEDRDLELSGTFESLAPREAIERPFGALQFRRVFRLGDQVNTDAVEARVRQGVLTVVLPKVAAAQPKQININAA